MSEGERFNELDTDFFKSRRIDVNVAQFRRYLLQHAGGLSWPINILQQLYSELSGGFDKAKRTAIVRIHF